MIQLLRTDGFPEVTCIPNTFIDEHLSRANGDFIKIYLYLLRSLSDRDSDLSISALADAMNFTENDVIRALKYWEKVNVLHLSFDEAGSLSHISLGNAKPSSADPTVPTSPTEPANPVAPTELSASPLAGSRIAPVPSPAALSDRPHFSADDLTSFKADEAVSDLFFAVEQYIGQPLSDASVEAILYWHRDLGFPIDLIEHLIESCLDAGHPSFSYMNRVALNWHSQGIRSVDQAKNTAEVHNVTYYGVKNALGISGRELIESEKKYIVKWTEEYGFSLDIIKDACRRTIEQASSPSFKYADRILSDWHQAGVKHLSDVAPLDKARQAKVQNAAPVPAAKHNFTSRSEESDEELEKRLLLSTGQA